MAVESPARSAEDLRDMTRRWLRDHLPAGWMEAIDAGDAGDRRRRSAAGSTTQQWCIEFGEAGYATPTWPAEYGAGLSLSPGDARFVNEVLNHYKVPRPFNIIGIGMGGPTVMAWGTEEMKHRLLRPLACNQEIWCQLFSEPGAGSDVAGPRDPCGARRRRVGRQRAEGLDHGRAALQVGDAALPHQPRRARSTAGCRTSSSTWSSPASRCGRWCRSPATPSSTRCSSTTRRVRHDWMLGSRGRRLEGRDHHADERAGVAVGRRVDRRRRGRREPARPPARHGTGASPTRSSASGSRARTSRAARSG